MCLYVTGIVQCIVKIFWWLMTGELCWWWAGELWVESERRGAGVLTLTTGPSTDHYHVGTRSFSSHSYPGHRRWYTAWGVSWSPVPRMTQHKPQLTVTNYTQIWTVSFSVSPSSSLKILISKHLIKRKEFTNNRHCPYREKVRNQWQWFLNHQEWLNNWDILALPKYASGKLWNQRHFVTIKKCCE